MDANLICEERWPPEVRLNVGGGFHASYDGFEKRAVVQVGTGIRTPVLLHASQECNHYATRAAPLENI